MPQQFESVCVIGLGYIGLPTASIMATRGFQVHGVDVNQHAVEVINQGRIHIHEPALDALVKSAVGSGRLKASLTAQPADVFILAVPTPFKGDKQPDVSYVEAATRSIAPHVRPGNLVILESTSPVGTTELVAKLLAEARPDLTIPRWRPFAPAAAAVAEGQVYVAHCPERVLPGKILQELVENDRIIGGLDPASASICEGVYRKFVNGKLLLTDSRTAELCKLTENSFRDVNIAFANELSLICDKLEVSVWELIKLANHHPRVQILQPGPGVGGHCIAVDPWFIVASAPKEARLIRTAREVNDHKPHAVVARIQAEADRFKAPVIACLGLAFKAGIDDLRESPSLEIAKHLVEHRVGRILAVEPYITKLPGGCEGLELLEARAAIQRADIVVMLVNHPEFLSLDRRLLHNKIVIDTRGVWQ
jgi:UDP-N-acetyl-D-mannosaminuronic acid dehydrogenase